MSKHTRTAAPMLRADVLLRHLAGAKAALARAESDQAAEVMAVRRKHAAGIDPLAERVALLERNLRNLMKDNRIILFGEAEDVRVDYEHGALFYKVSRPVKRVKKFWEKLLAAGRHDLLGQPPPPPVKWDKIEELPDDELAALGTERVRKEEFGFEVFDHQGTKNAKGKEEAKK